MVADATSSEVVLSGEGLKVVEVTKVFVRLADNNENPRLRAYCTIIIDNAFAVHDLKIIDGNDGIFVAMPTRKIRTRCPGCNRTNPTGQRWCGNCGRRLEETQRQCLDSAHPVTQNARFLVEDVVLDAFWKAEDDFYGEPEQSTKEEQTPQESER